jgi:glycosyltransferase involved in cell wall biosynthesis
VESVEAVEQRTELTSPLLLAVRTSTPEPLPEAPICPLFTRALAFKETYDSAMARLTLFHASHASDPALVTFILPTIQRPSLQRAITSLFQQTCPHWKAIILFDGCQPMVKALPSLKDPRIMFASIVKTGTVSAVHSKAGYVRNVGLQWVQTPWVAFLDDDDRLTPDYVERLQEECRMTPTADLIVFKMNDKALILPPPSSTQIVKNEIGISFAYRSSLIQKGFQFRSSEHEDYHLVHSIYQAGKQVVFSPYVTYVVRNSVYRQPSTMDRVCLL